jgi:hypothetical protein
VRGGRRGRTTAILAILAAGALLLIASTQTWVSVSLRESPDAALQVAGAAAVPVLAPLALASLAVGGALSIAGRVLGTIFGALALALGILLVILIAPVAVDPPIGTVAATVTEATGIAGEPAIAQLVASITAGAWPAIALVCAAVLAGAGGVVLATAHRWRASGRRYRTDSPRSAPAAGAQETGTLDAIDSWDDLSHGTDPTR